MLCPRRVLPIMNSVALALPELERPANRRLRIALALLTLYLVWGSTYLAIRVGLQAYPPFGMPGIRFLIAGALMFAVLRLRGMPAPTLRQWRNSAFVGFLLLTGGNGLVCYAEQSVSSGLTAVAVASMPLFAALFAGMYGDWPRKLEWVGLLVGFAGVVLLNIGGSLGASPSGAIALIAAPLCWAFGSVWSRRQDMPPPAMNTAAQMLCGGAFLIPVAWLHGEHLPTEFPLMPTLAVVYLALAGSILAFSAYVYLLENVRPALATSYAYVNPPVAVLFGVLLGGESVHPLDIVGMLVILTGVAAITLTRAKKQEPKPVSGDGTEKPAGR
jgi:drug/metabolite transporter (DMT)-like permease